MAKHSNIVRFIDREQNQEQFIKAFEEFPNCSGLLSHILIHNGGNNFCSCGIWKDKDSMETAMPKMLVLLDATRHLLEQISPETGVTEPTSGSVGFEQIL